jgi:hypothetical protein
VVGGREAIELAVLAGHGDRVTSELEPRRRVRMRRLEHPVAGFLGAAGLADDDRQRPRELGADRAERSVHPVRVGVVEEEGTHRIGGRAKGLGDELRPERRAPDAHDQKVPEAIGFLWPDLAAVHVGGESVDRR